jgi:hypothetical protein
MRFIFAVLSLLLITILPAFVNGHASKPHPSVTPTYVAAAQTSIAMNALTAVPAASNALMLI